MNKRIAPEFHEGEADKLPHECIFRDVPLNKFNQSMLLVAGGRRIFSGPRKSDGVRFPRRET